MNRTIFATVLVLLLPLALAAQAEVPAQQRIDDAVERIAEAGMPEHLLERRIAEGKAKGVPLERIAHAIEQRSAALLRARGVMQQGGGVLSADDLSMGADAVQAGVDDAVLATLSARAPDDRRAVAIAALGDLVRQGHASEEALARVTEALAHGPEALANLPARARRGPPIGAGRPGDLRPGRDGPPVGVPATGRGAEERGRRGPPTGTPGQRP